jgi:hypothetical protein
MMLKFSNLNINLYKLMVSVSIGEVKQNEKGGRFGNENRKNDNCWNAETCK